MNSPLVNSRMAVIYGKDFLTHSINMITGKTGSAYCNTNETSVCNAGSDFEYNNYYHEALSAGIEGSVVGGIINITNEIKYSEDYASIYYDSSAKSIKKYSADIIGSYELMNGNSKSYALVKLGNAYVIRDYSYNQASLTQDKISKLVIVDYKADEYVVIRWDLLSPLSDTSSSYSSYRHPHIHPINPEAYSDTHSNGPLIVTIIVWIFAILSVIVLVVDCAIKNRRTYVQVSPNDVISNTINSENL